LNTIIKPQQAALEKQKLIFNKRMSEIEHENKKSKVVSPRKTSNPKKYELKERETAFNEVILEPVQKQLEDLKIAQEQFNKDLELVKSKYPNFLRKNKHAERDPDVTLKFKDGGKRILEEMGIENEVNEYEFFQSIKNEEEKKSTDFQNNDILKEIVLQYNQSKHVTKTNKSSPFSS
jgi:hypothetical protein